LPGEISRHLTDHIKAWFTPLIAHNQR